MVTRYTASDVEQYCNYVGIYVATYSPGDGVTRYRFFREPSSYFGNGYQLATVLGVRAAWDWVSAFRCGREEGMRQITERISTE